MSAFNYFRVTYVRTIDEFCSCHDDEAPCEAIIKVNISGAQEGEKEIFVAAEGRDSVDALDKALHKALDAFFPCLQEVRMIHLKGRTIDVNKNKTDSKNEISITFLKGEKVWVVRSISVSRTKASLLALVEGLQVVIAESFSA